MLGNDRWHDNWRTLSSSEATCVDVARSRARRVAAKRIVRGLPSGAPVVLRASAPAATARCRRFAAQTGLHVEREYLAFPSAGAPAYLVEDAPASVDAFVERILVTPPRMPFSSAVDVCLSILRVIGPRLLIRAVAPGRVVVGRRV